MFFGQALLAWLFEIVQVGLLDCHCFFSGLDPRKWAALAARMMLRIASRFASYPRALGRCSPRHAELVALRVSSGHGFDRPAAKAQNLSFFLLTPRVDTWYSAKQ